MNGPQTQEIVILMFVLSHIEVGKSLNTKVEILDLMKEEEAVKSYNKNET